MFNKNYIIIFEYICICIFFFLGYIKNYVGICILVYFNIVIVFKFYIYVLYFNKINLLVSVLILRNC